MALSGGGSVVGMAEVFGVGHNEDRWVLDTSRGGPVSPVVWGALEAVGAAGWSDPRSITAEGRRAGQLLAAARASIATALSAPAESLVVTTGAAAALTEALIGLVHQQTRLGNSPVLIVSAIDHSAVLRVARWWAHQGGAVEKIGADLQGHIDTEALIDAAKSHPHAVVALQWANPEVGTVQPIETLGTALAQTGAHVLLDATAALGRIELPETDGFAVVAADALSWGGPRGVAVLGIRDVNAWQPPEPQIADESAVALTVAAASSLEMALGSMAQYDQTARTQTARVRSACSLSVSDLDIPGDPDHRLPHVLTLSALYLDGESLVQRLDAQGLALGSGSACTNDSGEPSHVLAAMGALTGGNLRLSLPLALPDEPIDRLIDILPGIIEELRAPL